MKNVYIAYIYGSQNYFNIMNIDFSFLATSLGIGGLATSLGIGGLLGFLMGYAVKKVIKIIIVLAGLSVGILYYLQYNGLIALNWGKLEETVRNSLTGFDNLTINASSFIPGIGDQIINAFSHSGIPLTGGFAAGFAFGFSKG